MHFVIYCLDNPSTPNARNEHYPQHREYLAKAPLNILAAGPLLDEISESRIGSMLLVEAVSLNQARLFAEGDPFFIKNVWNDVVVRPFIKAI